MQPPNKLCKCVGWCARGRHQRRRLANKANEEGPISKWALLQKGVAWHSGDAQQQGFDLSIQRLAHSITRAFLGKDKPFRIHTDASDAALGAAISQNDEKVEMRLVACMRKKLVPAERNYPAHEREILALVVAMKYWSSYLSGFQIMAYTDSSFTCYMKTCEMNSP